MIQILNAKSKLNSNFHVRLFREPPDVGDFRVFCSDFLRVGDLNAGQLKNLLAGECIQIRHWLVGVLEDESVELATDQSNCHGLKVTNTVTNYIHFRVYALIPTYDEVKGFVKFAKVKGFSIDHWIDLAKDGRVSVGDHNFEFTNFEIHDNRLRLPAN